MPHLHAAWCEGGKLGAAHAEHGCSIVFPDWSMRFASMLRQPRLAFCPLASTTSRLAPLDPVHKYVEFIRIKSD